MLIDAAVRFPEPLPAGDVMLVQAVSTKTSRIETRTPPIFLFMFPPEFEFELTEVAHAAKYAELRTIFHLLFSG
jgi:hypothetical protein